LSGYYKRDLKDTTDRKIKQKHYNKINCLEEKYGFKVKRILTACDLSLISLENNVHTCRNGYVERIKDSIDYFHAISLRLNIGCLLVSSNNISIVRN